MVSNPIPRPASFPIRTVPLFTVTPPVNVFAPFNVNTADPAFVRANAPAKEPLNTTPLAVVTVEFAVNVVGPLNVRTPDVVACPSDTEGPSEIALDSERSAVELLASEPPARTTTPAPRAESLPT
jgi:hypothetical protein